MENAGLGIIVNVLQMAKEKNASDVHLAAGMRLMFRVDGELIPASDESVEPIEIESLLSALLNERQKEVLLNAGELETSRSVANICRIRINVFRQRGTYAMTLHLLPLKIPSVEELGLPESLYALARRQSGLLLAAGTAGSGKTTTIASIVNSIARSVSKSVITIEQPIEYLYQPGESIICQREAGIDSISYMSALSSVLHQDADIVVLGGLRDIDTVSLAITAAKTGHLVMAPLETDSAAEAVECLADFYPIAQQQKMRQRLADVLLGVTAQQLLPKREGVGRIAAFEVMTVTPLVKSLLCDGKTKQLMTVMQAGADNGMQTMDGALYELYMKSRISAETAVRFSRDADSMRQKL